MLKISLVIPAYNEERYMEDCLNFAINNSDDKLFEIIVVDNNSLDKTAQVARKFPQVKVVRELKKGTSAARDRGFRESKGEILAFIDADTHMPKDWIATILREFSSSKDLVFLSGPYTYYDIPKWRQFLVKIYYFLALPVYWIVGYMATGGNFAIRKDTLDKMGGFDTSIQFYGDDTNLVRRASKFGKTKFDLSFVMPTSGRRFQGQGLLSTAKTYVLNFFSEVIFHKPFTKDHTIIR